MLAVATSTLQQLSLYTGLVVERSTGSGSDWWEVFRLDIEGEEGWTGAGEDGVKEE